MQPDDKNQTTPVLAIYISTEPVILLFKPVNRPLKIDCSNGNTYNRLPQHYQRLSMLRQYDSLHSLYSAS